MTFSTIAILLLYEIHFCNKNGLAGLRIRQNLFRTTFGNKVNISLGDTISAGNGDACVVLGQAGHGAGVFISGEGLSDVQAQRIVFINAVQLLTAGCQCHAQHQYCQTESQQTNKCFLHDFLLSA